MGETSSNSYANGKMKNLLDRITVLGISAHPRIIPSDGPFSAPAGPLCEEGRPICCERTDAYTYEGGQLFDEKRITHETMVAHNSPAWKSCGPN